MSRIVRGPGRDRSLAVALLCGVFLAGYLVVIHPFWTVPWLAAKAQAASLQQRELRQRMQLSQAAEIENLLAQARARKARNPGMLAENDTALATAGLVQRLESVVVQASPENRSCAISHRAPAPAAEIPGEPYARVSVEVRLRCGVAEFATVLRSLEGGAPRLFVESLSVSGMRNPVRGQEASSHGGLEANFVLYGFMQPALPERAHAQ